MFSWHILGPLIKVEQRLNATGYLNIIANQVHPFMAAVYPSAIFFFFFPQQDNAPRHKAGIVQEWFHEHDSEFSHLPAKLTEVWEALESIRASIPVEHCGHLVEYMP